MSTVIKTVSFDSEKDARLLACIDALESGTFSQVARDALAAYFQQGNGVTLAMLYSKVCDVEHKLDRGVVAGAIQDEPGQDDTGDRLSPDILGAFD